MYAKNSLCMMDKYINHICMDVIFGHDEQLVRFCWSCPNFQGHCRTNCKINTKKYFCALHLINQLTNFNQSYKDITLQYDKELNWLIVDLELNC